MSRLFGWAYQAGDLIVVEGVSHYFTGPRRGEIVAFKAPSALEDIVEARGEHLDGSEKFVKRVGCVQGDRVLLRRE
jgi:signal peptidase I